MVCNSYFKIDAAAWAENGVELLLKVERKAKFFQEGIFLKSIPDLLLISQEDESKTIQILANTYLGKEIRSGKEIWL